jgi:hypothetical protein
MTDNILLSLFVAIFLLSGNTYSGEWHPSVSEKAVTYEESSAWELDINAVFMTRSSPDSLTYITQPNGSDAFNFSQFEFDYDPGVDVSISRALSPGRALEFRYFSLADVNASERTGPFPAGGVGYNTNPPSGAGFFGVANFVNGTYNSEVRSGEINYKISQSENFSFGIGFRYLSLDELFIGAFDLVIPNQGNAQAWTTNDLYGIQVGGSGLLYSSPNSKLSLSGSAKAGVYHNDASNLLGNTFTRRFGSVSRDGTAFVGEAGLKVKYSLCKNIDLQAGYQLLWLDGVAVASEQLASSGNVFNLNRTAGMNDSGSALFHGFTVGTGIRF